MPGMDVRAALTVVGDGPVGSVGRQIRRRVRHARGTAPARLGARHEVGRGPARAHRARAGDRHPHPRLPRAGDLRLPLRARRAHGVARASSCPSWFDSPVRTAYRYLQHWMQHPYLWRHLEGGRLRSWGAKSLQESGRQGEPWLVGRRLRAHRRRLGQHERAHRARAWTRRGRPARCSPRASLELLRAGAAVHAGEPRARLRRAAPRELGRAGRPRGRARARRLPARASSRDSSAWRWRA